MIIDPASAGVIDVYNALVGTVTPRPIAWVSSRDREGRVNLAPFSFFNVFGANPPIVAFSSSLRRDKSRKDTLNNVEATGEFVINAAVEALAAEVNLSAKEIPPGESEVELTGLSLKPSIKIQTPRIAESPVHLECKLLQILQFGDGPISANLVIGQVVLIHIEDHILNEHGRPDPRKLQTIGRLGGDDYCRTSELFQIKRPT